MKFEKIMKGEMMDPAEDEDVDAGEFSEEKELEDKDEEDILRC